MTWVGGTGCNAATYTYNALGQRVEKHVGSAYTEIVYDVAGQPIGYHNRTAWTKQYVPLGAGMVALYQDNATFFIHPNHLGSTTMVFNHTGGSVAQDEIFYPWGERWNYAGTLYDERFASMQLRDAESGLDPTLFRMYESRLYRWLSPDPVAGSIFNPQSLNRYAYVLNNPVNLIDPLGLQGPCSGGSRPAPGTSCIPFDSYDMSRLFGGSGIWSRFWALQALSQMIPVTAGPFPAAYWGVEAEGLSASQFLGFLVVFVEDISPSLRQAGESFGDCVKRNSSNFSMVGLAENALSAAGVETGISESFVGNLLAGNDVTGVAFVFVGDEETAEESLAASLSASTSMAVPSAVEKPLTVGGKSGVQRLFPPRGRPPQALLRVTKLTKAVKAAKAANLFKGAVDLGFTGALAIACR